MTLYVTVLRVILCLVVKCPLLFAPNHGVIHGSQRYWECNSTVTFSCQPGYQLTGNSGSTCLDSGNWNSLTPECTSKTWFIYDVDIKVDYLFIDINECISNPCQNGGTCIDEIDGYTCFCALNFVGDLCDMRKIYHLFNCVKLRLYELSCLCSCRCRYMCCPRLQYVCGEGNRVF